MYLKLDVKGGLMLEGSDYSFIVRYTLIMLLLIYSYFLSLVVRISAHKVFLFIRNGALTL